MSTSHEPSRLSVFGGDANAKHGGVPRRGAPSAASGWAPADELKGVAAPKNRLLRDGSWLGVPSGAYRDRTGDLRLAKPALSQLS